MAERVSLAGDEPRA